MQWLIILWTIMRMIVSHFTSSSNYSASVSAILLPHMHIRDTPIWRLRKLLFKRVGPVDARLGKSRYVHRWVAPAVCFTISKSTGREGQGLPLRKTHYITFTTVKSNVMWRMCDRPPINTNLGIHFPWSLWSDMDVDLYAFCSNGRSRWLLSVLTFNGT